MKKGKSSNNEESLDLPFQLTLAIIYRQNLYQSLLDRAFGLQ
jgi:hypothetical protein